MARIDYSQVKRARQVFRKLPKELKSDLRKAQRAQYRPIWQESVERSVHGGDGTQRRVFSRSGSRVRAGVPAVLVAGASRRALSGGLVPDKHARAFEFGAKNRGYAIYYRRSPNGGQHRVRRRTRNQMNLHRRQGWVVYPAFYDEALERITSLNVQTYMRRIYEAAEE